MFNIVSMVTVINIANELLNTNGGGFWILSSDRRGKRETPKNNVKDRQCEQKGGVGQLANLPKEVWLRFRV